MQASDSGEPNSSKNIDVELKVTIVYESHAFGKLNYLKNIEWKLKIVKKETFCFRVRTRRKAIVSSRTRSGESEQSRQR